MLIKLINFAVNSGVDPQDKLGCILRTYAVNSYRASGYGHGWSQAMYNGAAHDLNHVAAACRGGGHLKVATGRTRSDNHFAMLPWRKTGRPPSTE